MKKVCVVTATRAEYGLLRLVIQEIIKDSFLELCLVVTGTHLSKKYGYTVQEIENDGFTITERINILNEENSCSGICDTMSMAMKKFGEFYKKYNPDLLVVLGDRYELIPICSAALVFGIPIAHISGGEVTEGAIDDAIRHSISKMSYLHFPGCEIYRRRIIQLGENPERVYNFGDVGVENIRKMDYMSKEELENSIGISLGKQYAAVTFHPVTLEPDQAKAQTMSLIQAIKNTPQINYIVTLSNADLSSEIINAMFLESERECNNITCFSSLGIRRYLSLLKYAEFVMGNSSSGIVEAPCFGIPTINIGNRQKGRLMAESVLCCDSVEKDILGCIDKALSKEFREIAKNCENPYGNGETSVKIVETIHDYLEHDKINLKKHFYDLEGEWEYM